MQHALAAVALTAALSGQAAFGRACDRNSVFLPVLDVSAPSPGRDVIATLRSAAPSLPLALLVGASNQRWGSVALPFALDGLGLPACELAVAIDVALGYGAAGSLTLPTAGLAGPTTVFLQGLIADPAGLAGTTRGIRLDLPGSSAPFTVAMLPDTQFYCEQPALHFHFVGQTQWIAQQRASVAFAVQVGDIVQNGATRPAEWTRAVQAMNVLDGVLPYTAALGNHDFDIVNDKATATSYTANFGAARYAGRPWSVAVSSDQRNSAQVFSGGDGEYLHLCLEWRPSDAALAFAQGVLARFPNLPTIVTTHEHLGVGDPAPWRAGGATPDGTGDNAADDVQHKLVEPFPQVFLILCGHVSGTGRRTDVTVLGQTVHAMLADYQSSANGGNGFMRTLQFEPQLGRIAVRTRSSTYVVGSGPDYATLPEHNFDLAYDGGGHRSRLQMRCLRWREGQDFGHGAYTGCVDTQIGDGSAGNTRPDRPRGNDDLLLCDGDQDHNQALLRFADLVGTGAHQIPPGTRVQRAILTLTTEGPNADSADGGKLYRMRTAWSEASTWNSLGAGVQVGLECLPTADVDSAGRVGAKSTRSFDVTASVQAWVDGAPNFGWVAIANGNDAWGVRSSEAAGLVERPLLSVW